MKKKLARAYGPDQHVRSGVHYMSSVRQAPPPRPVPTFPIQTEVTVLTDVGVAPRALGARSVPLVLRLASLQP